jgi:phosphoglycerate dehydrogenase-like enzyme
VGFYRDKRKLSVLSLCIFRIQDYQGIVIRSRFIDKQFLDKAINLQFIARVGASLESIDCDYATAKNVLLIAQKGTRMQ